MPCQAGPVFPSRAQLEAAELKDKLRDETAKLNSETAKLNSLEALLCGAFRVLDRTQYDFDENPELSMWWDKHKKKDAARQRREEKQKLRQEADALKMKQAVALLEKPIKSLTKEEMALVKSYKLI